MKTRPPKPGTRQGRRRTLPRACLTLAGLAACLLAGPARFARGAGAAVRLNTVGYLPEQQKRATDWVDDAENYRVNEIAVNWTAPLVYALAGSLPATHGARRRR